MSDFMGKNDNPKTTKVKKSMKSLGIVVWKNHTVVIVCKIKQHLLKEAKI